LANFLPFFSFYQPTSAEKAMATERLQPVSAGLNNTPSQKLQMRAKVQTQEDMRQELLGTKNNSGKLTNIILLRCASNTGR
jgi:hypothetical protein